MKGGMRAFARCFNKGADADHAADHDSVQAREWNFMTCEDKIEAICKSIREEDGNIASVFNDPQFLPCLIQYYPGFDAYARIVQARG